MDEGRLAQEKAGGIKKDAARIFIAALAYFAAHEVAFLFPDSERVLAAVWPAAGVGLAALLLSPRRQWAWIIPALFVAGNTADLLSGRPLFNSIGFMTANVLESLACAWLISWWSGKDVGFVRVKDIAALVVCCTVVNACTAFVGAGTAAIASHAPFWNFWFTWWVSDGLGILLVTPLIVAWIRSDDSLPGVRAGWVLESCLFMSILMVGTWLSFQGQTDHRVLAPKPYMLVALFAWAAFRLGPRIVTLGLTAMAILAVTSNGVTSGPLPWGGATLTERLLLMQGYAGFSVVAALLLGAIRNEAESSGRASREDQARLRALGDNLPNGMIYQVVREHDSTMHFLYVSGSVERLMGVSSEEVLRDPSALYGLIVDEDRPLVAAAEKASAQDLTVFNVTVRLRRPDSEVRWMQITSSPRLLPDGRILWDGVGIDMTEQKHAEEDLRTSSLQLAEAADLAKIAYWEHDRATDEFIFNDPFYELFGTTAEQEGGYRIAREEYRRRFVHSDDIEELRRQVSENSAHLCTDDFDQYEHRAVRRDGEVMHILNRNRVVMDSEGRILKVVGVNQDITSRKQMEESLREYEMAIEGSPDMMAVVDREYRYRLANPAFLKNRGFERDEVVGRTVAEVIGEETFAQTIKEDLDRCFQGERVQHEMKYAYPGLGERDLFVSYLPIRGPRGIDRVVSILRDITESRKAEEALEKSEQKYQSLFETMSDGFASVNMDRRIVAANPAYLAMTGYTEDELLTMTYDDLTPEKWHDPQEKIIQEQVLTRGYSDAYVKEYVRKDGTVFPVEIKSHLIRDEEGRPSGIWAFFRDVTERVNADEALRKSEERYHSLFSGMTEGFALHEVICDKEGRPSDYRFLDLNPAFEQLTGLKRDDLLNKTVKEAIPGIESHWIETYGKVALTGEPIHFEDFASALGKHYEVYAYSPAPRQFAALFTDITDRKHAEEALRESEAKLRAILDGSRDAIGVSKDEIRTFMNPAYVSLFGYESADELIGKPVMDLVAPESRGLAMEMARKRADGEPVPPFYEVTALRKDGTRFSAETTISSYVLKGGQFRLVTLRDITEKKRLEEQLRQAQKMEAVGTLAGGVAHDFNNILTVIMGLGNVIQMSVSPDDRIKPLVDQIVLSSEKAADLTKSLLAFSRKQRIALEPHKIDDVVAGAAKLLKRLLTEDIILKVELEAEHAVAMLDVAQMDQVLMNLATNARDAMPNGGSLVIRTDVATLDWTFEKIHGFGRPGMHTHLSVSDSGVGMDEKTVARIFDPFFTTKEVGKGTGLGLASVYGIVKQHGGYITVSSELLKGTTFDIYLPLVDATVQHVTAVPPLAKGGSETILVLEDDRDVRNLITRILSDRGYITMEAANGDDAIRVFGEHRNTISLVILDVVMPGKNGREVFDEITRIEPRARAVFMSGYTGDIVIDKGVEKENVDFLQKPLSVKALLTKVREVLDR